MALAFGSCAVWKLYFASLVVFGCGLQLVCIGKVCCWCSGSCFGGVVAALAFDLGRNICFLGCFAVRHVGRPAVE